MVGDKFVLCVNYTLPKVCNLQLSKKKTTWIHLRTTSSGFFRSCSRNLHRVKSLNTELQIEKGGDYAAGVAVVIVLAFCHRQQKFYNSDKTLSSFNKTGLFPCFSFSHLCPCVVMYVASSPGYTFNWSSGLVQIDCACVKCNHLMVTLYTKITGLDLTLAHLDIPWWK